MGWATGTNEAGREVGYSVKATCDQQGCNTGIDRGIDYVCGGMHDGGEQGCGKYFCGDHLSYGVVHRGEYRGYGTQLCNACAEQSGAPRREGRRMGEETHSGGGDDG